MVGRELVEHKVSADQFVAMRFAAAIRAMFRVRQLWTPRPTVRRMRVWLKDRQHVTPEELTDDVSPCGLRFSSVFDAVTGD